MNYTSQDGQDKTVLEHLNEMRDGYFVDIGAHDGITFSNTYVLEHQFGWSGLLIEANPAILHSLRNNRKSIIAHETLWSTSCEMEFKSIEGDTLSGLTEVLTHKKALTRPNKPYFVMTKTLDQVLDQYECPNHINYMSIDIEGAEYEVLSTFSFSRTFDIISVEHLRNKEEITNLLGRQGYMVLKTIMKDDETIFVRKT
jgi:FkbM family methyltransferase